MKKKNSVFTVFDNHLLNIVNAKGNYLIDKNGIKYLDTTAGGYSFAVLGYNNNKVKKALNNQLKKFAHVDFKIFNNDNAQILSNILLKNKKNKLDSVYYAGNSGGEANEAAMKLSYQVHLAQGNNKKKWFIGRDQSYHGIGTDNLSVAERPDLMFYNSFFSKYRSRIKQNFYIKEKKNNESEVQYSKRSASLLEKEILKIGPENVAAFLGETMMGGLIGDVPPSKNYWKYIRKICNKYNVHLILDEVYCGLGSSGKYYCCDWDEITPDFLTVSKTLTAGFIPLSAVITKAKFNKIIKKKFNRIMHGTTNQAHSLGLAAAIECQKIINNKKMLSSINKTGDYMRKTLVTELKNHDFFYNVRGRGLRFSLEYTCKNSNDFGKKLSKIMLEKHKIIISGKWHRICFTPSFLLRQNEINKILETIILEFKKLSMKWN